jgi:Tol biopolymer transport system component
VGAPLLLLAACALLVALAAFPAAADATWPGKPGKLAYQRVDGPIFSIRPDASHNHRLVREASGEPAFSPRGRSIAYPVSTELWRARADGSRRRRIARVDEAILHPAWGPSARRLVFTSGITRQSDSTSIDYIWVVRRSGKGLRRLGKGHDATWSSDGVIAFATNRGAIATIRPDGSGRRVWIPGKRGLYIVNLDFSPNGRRIVYQRYPLRGRSTIDTLNFRTGRRTRFTNLTKKVFADDVVWRPGGRRLAYVHRSEYPPGPPTEIRTIRPSGKRRKTLIKFRTAALVPGFAWQTRR